MIRGAGSLAIDDEPKGDTNKEAVAKPAKRKRDSQRDANVGNALRSVYSQAVNETVPDEFMDLLRKLD
jgi:hypothetical protein